MSCGGALHSPVARPCPWPLQVPYPAWGTSCLRVCGPGPTPGGGEPLRWGRSVRGWGGTLARVVIWTYGPSPQAFLVPSPPALHGSLLPRGLPGNIFLVNVYIFGDSWFICGQSVPGERHRAQPISGQGVASCPRSNWEAAPCPGACPSLPRAVAEALGVGRSESHGDELRPVQESRAAGLGGSASGMGLGLASSKWTSLTSWA